MSEHDHDEIARRLRETGTVSAPERLRGDVMDQVRAEPRRRPARRSFLRPVMPYAAAAAALIAVVAALAHFSGQTSHSGSSGSGGAAATGADSGARSPSPEAVGTGGEDLLSPGKSAGAAAGAAQEFHIAGRYLQSFALQSTDKAASPYPRLVVLVVPKPLYGAYLARFRFFERHSVGDASVRVILRRSAPR
jgi:hypothetical protein